MPDDNMTIRERYLEQMVESASPEGLLLMMVDGAANFVRRAGFELERGRLDEVHNCLVKAQNVYMELVISLDLEAGEFAENLALVYQYLYNLLIEANMDKSAEKIASALKLADEIRGLWKDAVEKSRSKDEAEVPSVSVEAAAPAVKVPVAGIYEPVGAMKIGRPGTETVDPPSRLNVTG